MVKNEMATEKMVVFDRNQKKSGVNKFGHYQFGRETCISCKSDCTFPHSEQHPNPKMKTLACSCGAVFSIDRL